MYQASTCEPKAVKQLHIGTLKPFEGGSQMPLVSRPLRCLRYQPGRKQVAVFNQAARQVTNFLFLEFSLSHSDASFVIDRFIPAQTRLVAGVAKLVDAPDLGSGAARRGGSSPSTRTKKIYHNHHYTCCEYARPQRLWAPSSPSFSKHIGGPN